MFALIVHTLTDKRVFVMEEPTISTGHAHLALISHTLMESHALVMEV